MESIKLKTNSHERSMRQNLMNAEPEKYELETELTRAAIRAHLFPILEWSLMIRFSSSLVKVPFFRSGLRWFAQRRRQLLPHLNSPVSFCTTFQFCTPCFLTYASKMASSDGVQGPFFSCGPALLRGDTLALSSSRDAKSAWSGPGISWSLSLLARVISQKHGAELCKKDCKL